VRFAVSQWLLFLFQAELQIVPVERSFLENCNVLCNVCRFIVRGIVKHADDCAVIVRKGGLLKVNFWVVTIGFRIV
jgi:hypothetical protein